MLQFNVNKDKNTITCHRVLQNQETSHTKRRNILFLSKRYTILLYLCYLRQVAIQKEEIFCFYPIGTQYYYTCVT